MYLRARCVAVPRSAAVSSRSTPDSSGTRKGRTARSMRSALSGSGSGRLFSSVAVTLLGRFTDAWAA